MRIIVTTLISISLLISCVGQSRLPIDKIDSIMKANYPEDQPGAAIIAYKDDKPFFISSYGLSNLEDSLKINDQTIFKIGSMTKQFTSIAVLMQVKSNKLSLADEVSKFYPEWFIGKPPITIQQLLAHTSGIMDLPRIEGIRELMFQESPPDSLVKLISKADLIFDPGSEYSYSNSGYVILGGILERVSGMSYDQFLIDHIFKPLNMGHSYYIHPEKTNADVAKGYFKRPDHFVNAPDVNSTLMYAAGGLKSNLEDMAKWNLALNSDKLLDQSLIDLAFTPYQLADGTYTDYGFGFRQCEVNGVPSIEHGGGVFGFKSYGVRIEEEGVYVLILSNFERENNYDYLAPYIAAEVMGKSYDSTEGTLPIAAHLKQELTGRYLVEPGDTVSISFDEDILMMSRGERQRELYRINQNTFYSLEYSLEYDPRQKNKVVIKHRRSMAEEALKI